LRTLSVIIVNYNVRHFLEQCLHSVMKACEGIDSEVFVVDNNSVDGSPQMVREKFPAVNLIENRENAGFSAANNQAIKVTSGKYVLLLNPDTVVEESTFVKSIAFLESHPDGGALGVKMIDGKGKFLPESKRGIPTPWVSFYKIFGLWKLFPKSRKFGRYYLSHLDREKNHEIEVLSGAFMMLRREALNLVGLLDEDFFMYGEDIDLSYRLIRGGYKNYYLSETKIIHYKGESTKKASFNYVRTFYQAMIIFARKHFSPGRQRTFITAIRLAVYFRAILAITGRIIRTTAFPAIEAVLIFVSIISIKEYWEYIHKLLKDKLPYPAEFDFVAAPLYTLVFVLLLAAFGAYRKPYKIRPILTATFTGFVTIALVSWIAPEINFSRMIVGLASVATAIIAIITRGMLNFKAGGKFFFTEEHKKRVVIVGSSAESDRISRLIRGDLDYPVEIVGRVAAETAASESGKNDLGTIAQLHEIIPFYRIDEVIFANESLTTQKIIGTMASLKFRNLQYKIVPPRADYLVGPQVIHSSIYTGPAFYNLDKREFLVKKRVFDVIGSSLILIVFPLHFWLYKNPVLAMKNLRSVLVGQYHFVGYIRSHPVGLPGIKDGILNMLHRVRKGERRGKDHSAGLDRHYAKTYSWELDLEILLKGLRKIGEVRKV